MSPYHSALFSYIQNLLEGSLTPKNNPYEAEIDEWRDKYDTINEWYRFRELEELSLANAKYHEISYVQIRRQSAQAEFNEIINE